MKDKRFKTLSEIKREHIIKVLDATQWDFKKASTILNVSETYLKKELKQIKETVKIKSAKKKIHNPH